MIIETGFLRGVINHFQGFLSKEQNEKYIYLGGKYGFFKQDG
jgi:hypothetical protein